MRNVLSIIWFGLAIIFVLVGSGTRDIDEPGAYAAPRISAADIDSAPRRSPLSDPPRLKIGGVEQKCSDCHALFASQKVTPSNIRQHTHIALDHGMNDRCFNCHSQSERNHLVMHDESLVGFEQATQLCSKCHGTVFRDWERGMHGKTLGSWDASSGNQVRLECIQCHDPHAPAFGQHKTLPGPNSRGYRPPDDHGGAHGPGDAELTNPLERWKRGATNDARPSAQEDH